MITIQTNTSRIRHADGSLATGILTLTPTAPFTYTVDGADIMVTQNAVSVRIIDGVLEAALSLSPCRGVTHDVSGVTYKAQFKFGFREETEYWILDTDNVTLEITDVTLATAITAPPTPVLPNPPAAYAWATAALQTLGNVTLTELLSAIGLLAKKTDTQPVSVQNSVAVTGAFYPATQPVSAETFPLPTGAATAAKQDDEVTAIGQVKTAVQSVEVATSDSQLAIVAALQDVITALANIKITADSVNLNTDGLEAAQANTIAALESAVTALGNISISADSVNLNTDGLELLLTNLLAELTLKANQTETQPVSAASLPLPAGAATSAAQTTLQTAIDLQAKKTENQPVQAATLVNSVAAAAFQVITDTIAATNTPEVVGISSVEFNTITFFPYGRSGNRTLNTSTIWIQFATGDAGPGIPLVANATASVTFTAPLGQKLNASMFWVDCETAGDGYLAVAQ